jgi:hypothetical protein
VVSATRIEPPLHPEGPEKILEDFGIEPEEFKEQELISFVDEIQSGDGILYGPLALNRETSEGIFAPWAMYKEDFLAIGGHDPLYAPQSKEDSDIFNRFVLAGYELKQTWKGFVYHMTCRGSRFADGAKRNPDGQVFMKNRETDEWLKQNEKSTKEFKRKWGHFPAHDELLKPIIPPRYDIGLEVKNLTKLQLEHVEPYVSVLYCNDYQYETIVKDYIEKENTSFDLSKRIKRSSENKKDHSVNIIIDGSNIRNEMLGPPLSKSSFIQDFVYELAQSIFLEEDFGEELEIGLMEAIINNVDGKEKSLIKCNIS